MVAFKALLLLMIFEMKRMLVSSFSLKLVRSSSHHFDVKVLPIFRRYMTVQTSNADSNDKVPKVKSKDKASKGTAETDSSILSGAELTAYNEGIRQERINKSLRCKEMGMNPYAYTFSSSHKTTELQEIYKDLPSGEEDQESTISLAGRIINRRVFGKLAFFNIQDSYGNIQFYLDKSHMGEAFDSIRNLTDVGDIVGASGTVKRTEKGELSVKVSTWTMLTKALLPLPDKHKGLTDINRKYRSRHLDLIVNPEVKQRFLLRSKIISKIRTFLDSKGVLEMEVIFAIQLLQTSWRLQF